MIFEHFRKSSEEIFIGHAYFGSFNCINCICIIINLNLILYSGAVGDGKVSQLQYNG